MTPQTLPALDSLEFRPYVTDAGTVADGLAGKIGIYAIFDTAQQLQYVGYSRNVELSLKQHLVRYPERCMWLKVALCDRPNRTLLDETRQAWQAQAVGWAPLSPQEEASWTDPMDVRGAMTEAEHTDYNKADEATQRKLLKTVARRVEAEVLSRLEARGVTLPLRFDPKLKEDGKLNLKAEP